MYFFFILSELFFFGLLPYTLDFLMPNNISMLISIVLYTGVDYSFSPAKSWGKLLCAVGSSIWFWSLYQQPLWYRVLLSILLNIIIVGFNFIITSMGSLTHVQTP